LYLIKILVDQMHIGGDATQHTIELILGLEGDGHGRFPDEASALAGAPTPDAQRIT
jgi:hypothetical protein